MKRKEFTCTKCNRPCSHRTTSLKRYGIEWIKPNEALCYPCTKDRRQTAISIHTMPKHEKEELLNLI